jgi:hypothetical protein
MMLECPFCKDSDFDDIGLKLHLLRGHCEAFEAVPDWTPTFKEQA